MYDQVPLFNFLLVTSLIVQVYLRLYLFCQACRQVIDLYINTTYNCRPYHIPVACTSQLFFPDSASAYIIVVL